MANVAGRPNISNEVLDENGKFTSIWYRFMEQIWVRSGGSDDDVSGLRDAIELVELIPTTENIPQDDLLPPIVEKEVQDDLAPRFEIDQDALTAADIGVTVQAFSANLDTYAANSLTEAELGELQNINSVTITNVQWAFLGAFDQGLATTDNPTFGEITATTGINLGGTASVNLLDDYERGTFVVALIAGTSGTITLVSNRNTLSFVKIGQIVHIMGRINVDTVSAPLGTLRMTGLPFASINLTELSERSGFYIAPRNLAGSVNVLQGNISGGATQVEIEEFTGTTTLDDVADHMMAGSALVFDFSYQA